MLVVNKNHSILLRFDLEQIMNENNAIFSHINFNAGAN